MFGFVKFVFTTANDSNILSMHFSNDCQLNIKRHCFDKYFQKESFVSDQNLHSETTKYSIERRISHKVMTYTTQLRTKGLRGGQQTKGFHA